MRNFNIGLTAPPQATAPIEEGGMFKTPWVAFFNQAYVKLRKVPTILDVAAAMNATAGNVVNYPPEANLGLFYFQTDTGLTYVSRLIIVGAALVPTWVYFSGQLRNTQATLPVGLTINDVGMLVFVTDFNHTLRWASTLTWQWAPGENGSGFIDAFLVDPSPVTGWALCDGSAGVSYLRSNGTLGTVTLPNLTGTPAYVKLGSTASAAINVSTKPSFDPTKLTAATHVTGVTPNLTTAAVASGAGTTVVTGVTLTDPGHTHSITQTSTPVNADGEPANVALRPFFRR